MDNPFNIENATFADPEIEKKIKQTRTTKRNKRRSRGQEGGIARALRGRVVPMSGAGSFKGDVHAPSLLGDYVVECKLSERTDKQGLPQFRFDLMWMSKVRGENVQERKAFGCVVFTFFQRGRHKNFAAMYLTDLLRLPYVTFEQRPEHTIEVQKKSITFALSGLEKHLELSYNPNYTPQHAVSLWADDVYVIMPFDEFKEIVLRDVPPERFFS